VAWRAGRIPVISQVVQGRSVNAEVEAATEWRKPRRVRPKFGVTIFVHHNLDVGRYGSSGPRDRAKEYRHGFRQRSWQLRAGGAPGLNEHRGVWAWQDLARDH